MIALDAAKVEALKDYARKRGCVNVRSHDQRGEFGLRVFWRGKEYELTFAVDDKTSAAMLDIHLARIKSAVEKLTRES